MGAYVLRQCNRECPKWDLHERHIVYCGMLAYCTLKNLGGTRRGMWLRLQDHVDAATSGASRQALYPALARMGVHCIVWTPLIVFNHVTIKRERLRAEGEITYDRNAQL